MTLLPGIALGLALNQYATKWVVKLCSDAASASFGSFCATYAFTMAGFIVAVAGYCMSLSKSPFLDEFLSHDLESPYLATMTVLMISLCALFIGSIIFIGTSPNWLACSMIGLLCTSMISGIVVFMHPLKLLYKTASGEHRKGKMSKS